ncbi:MAG TPA: hypothetical protein VJB35_03030 [Candidatus Nanoarchaeia archaeon]|nr:hypothetical protein [Candidatus Nanoarchaeia archaeon]
MKKLLVIIFIMMLMIGNIPASSGEGIIGATAVVAVLIALVVQIIQSQALTHCDPNSEVDACMTYVKEQGLMQDVYSEAIEVAPENVTKIIEKYKQVDLYEQGGAKIDYSDPLKIDEEGQIVGGTLQFSSTKEEDIGKLIGKDIGEGEIIVKGVTLEKKEGISKLIFGENASLKISGKKFENIKSQDEAKLPSFIEIDSTGKILNASFTTNESGGVYDFGKGDFKAPPNSRVIYNINNNEPPKIEIPEGSEDFGKILKGEDIPKGEAIYQSKSDFKFDGNEIKGLDGKMGRVTVENGKIVKVWEGTDATIDGINHKTFGADLNVYYNEDFNALSHKGENYFNYGNQKMWLGGGGFTSSLTKDNKIFPEFIEEKYPNSFTPRKGRLEFTLNGGNLEVSKISPDNQPLALDINAEGKFEIQNGALNFDASKGEIYTKIKKDSTFTTQSDMKINYLDSSGKLQKYNFDASSAYKIDSEKQTGYFAETLSTNNGDAQVSYSEFIEGFPVIKNTNTYYYYDAFGNKYKTPVLKKQNKDVLDLIVDSSRQNCATTQRELDILWRWSELEKGNIESFGCEIANGKTLSFSKEEYSIWDQKSNQVITKKYDENLKYQQLKEFTESVQANTNTGLLAKILIPINNVNDLRPGDMIVQKLDTKTGYGHLVGIKRIIQIKGSTYYEIFAGSDPATEAAIYNKLYSQNELLALSTRNMNFLRFPN